MSLGDRLGLAGVILAFIAIAAPYLWPDKKWIGWIALGCALMLGLAWGWMEFGNEIPRLHSRYPIKSTMAAFVIGGLLAITLWRLVGTSALATQEESKAHSIVPTVAQGTIEMTYDMNMMGLPLVIQPYTSATIIQIKDRTRAEALVVNNPARTVSYWPREKMGFPPSGVGIINVANHGTIALFNVAAIVRFDVGAQKSPGGVSTMYFRLPLIESLRPSDPSYRFYVVDDSSLGGLVFMPETVDADVPAGGRQKIQVAARKLTFMDNVPMLPPAFSKPTEPPKGKGKRK